MQVTLWCFASVLLCLAALSESSKEWEKEQRDKKYVTPKKGIHYRLPKHPKSHGEHHWSTFGAHHPHKSDKHTKDVAKHAPHTVGQHEAKLQSDLKTSRKHIREQYDKWAREDMHLQDLSYDSHVREQKKDHGLPHHTQGRYNERKHGHLNKGHRKEHDFGFKHSHAQSYHHGNRKSGSHHKYRPADKLTKNKRKKAYEKKHGKKHSKKHRY